MYSMAALLHYIIIGFVVVIPAVAVACGQMWAGDAVLDAINTQPYASKESLYAYIFGTALSETAAIVTTIMGFVLLMGTHEITLPASIAQLGIFFGLIFPATLVGFLSLYPQREAMTAIARQPFDAQKITNLMILALSMMQLSVILGLIIGFIMYFKVASVQTVEQALEICAAGFAFGGGACGPLFGMAQFTAAACRTVGRFPQSYNQILSTSFVSQALIETPILFSLGVSLFILIGFATGPLVASAAALTMTLCTIGPGIASGRIATAACEGIGRHPEKVSLFSYTSMIGQTLIDASAIYGVIVVALLFLVV